MTSSCSCAHPCSRFQKIGPLLFQLEVSDSGHQAFEHLKYEIEILDAPPVIIDSGVGKSDVGSAPLLTHAMPTTRKRAIVAESFRTWRNSDLFGAVKAEDEETVRRLIDAGSDIKRGTPWSYDTLLGYLWRARGYENLS